MFCDNGLRQRVGLHCVDKDDFRVRCFDENTAFGEGSRNLDGGWQPGLTT